MIGKWKMETKPTYHPNRHIFPLISIVREQTFENFFGHGLNKLLLASKPHFFQKNLCSFTLHFSLLEFDEAFEIGRCDQALFFVTIRHFFSSTRHVSWFKGNETRQDFPDGFRHNSKFHSPNASKQFSIAFLNHDASLASP